MKATTTQATKALRALLPSFDVEVTLSKSTQLKHRNEAIFLIAAQVNNKVIAQSGSTFESTISKLANQIKQQC